MTKILFLDIDGVINDMEYFHAHWKEGPWTLNPKKLDLLHEVLDKTGAKLVISSAWRLLQEGREYLERYLGPRMHLDAYTPSNNQKIGNIYLGKIRGDDIKAWLDNHPEIETYAILDDDSDMLHEQKPFFIQTSPEKGLMDYHVEFLIEILGEK